MVNHEWTAEEDAAILAGRAASLSYYEIAARLLKTPGQVIGRAHRLDVPTGEPIIPPDAIRVDRRAEIAAAERSIVTALRAWTPKFFRPPTKCEWIDGDDFKERIARGEEVHCGRKVARGAFCEEHAADAYNGIPKPKGGDLRRVTRRGRRPI